VIEWDVRAADGRSALTLESEVVVGALGEVPELNNWAKGDVMKLILRLALLFLLVVLSGVWSTAMAQEFPSKRPDETPAEQTELRLCKMRIHAEHRWQT
jgi:hypothetical protein